MKLKSGESKTIDPQDPNATAAGVTTDEQKRLRALIGRRHPKYDAKVAHWSFMEATYGGGREWFDDNIFRYIKEGEQEFADRLERCYRFSHSREVVDLINKYLFKQHVTRSEDAPEAVKTFWKKATKSGLDITDLMRQVSKKTSMVGRVGIVVDSTAPAGHRLSRAEAKAAGARIYAYIVGPDQLLDYSRDIDGSLNWALVREVARDDADPFTSSGVEVDRYRLWTKSDWSLYEERLEGRRKVVVMVDSGEHGLGEVPIVLADNVIGDDDDYAPPSMIDDIAYLDRAVANYLSNLDAIIQDQTFSQLAMPAQNVLPGEDNYNKLVEMGTKRVFLYDGEGGGQPFYLSPDVKQAELIVTVINKIIGEIYHTVGLAGERTKQDNAVGIDNSSGVAKAYDFERVNALLAAKADSLENVENRLTRLVALWSQEAGAEEDLVSYPDNFDTRGLYDEFDIAARLMLIDAPRAVRQEQMKTVLDKLFPQLAADLRKKMEGELKDWPANPLELMDGLAKPQPKSENTPTPAGGKGKKPLKDKRQGQVTESSE